MKLGLALFCFLLLSNAAAVRAQDVAVDFDRGANFSRFKSYSWASGVPAKNPLIDEQIKAAVDERLAAKGLRRVGEGGDLSVMYFAAVDRDLQVATAEWMNTGNWLSQTESGISVRSQTWDVADGTLVVCLSDASTRSLLWRGTAKTTLDKKNINKNYNRSRDTDIIEAMSEDAKKVNKRVRKSVEKMFRRYPAAKPAA